TTTGFTRPAVSSAAHGMGGAPPMLPIGGRFGAVPAPTMDLVPPPPPPEALLPAQMSYAPLAGPHVTSHVLSGYQSDPHSGMVQPQPMYAPPVTYPPPTAAPRRALPAGAWVGIIGMGAFGIALGVTVGTRLMSEKPALGPEVAANSQPQAPQAPVGA